MTVNVDEVMREIEDEVRRARRQRLLAHGAAPEYRDARIYAMVDGILRRAIDERDHDALLVNELAAGEESDQLATHLRFGSHRRLLGPVVVFAKRRILLPAMRWLYEYSLDNFRRQARLNRILLACIEELAIQNAGLRLRIAELQDGGIAGGNSAIAGLQDGGIAGGNSAIAGLQDGGIAGGNSTIAGLEDYRIAGTPDGESAESQKGGTAGKSDATSDQ